MLTVIFATYNGERTLPEVLEAHCRVESPPDGWKLVIVDNGSTDQSAGIIHSFSRRLPLTYLLEPAKGKNAALNAGLEHVSGDLVVFTDDDAIPRPDWLLRLRDCSAAHADFSIFGGVVLPRWESPPPQWVLNLPSLETAFAVTNPAWEDGPIPASSIFGPNMAVRAEIFRQHRFSASIGPCGQAYAMGSETEFTRRMANAGYKCRHCKSAVVEHIIRSFQMNKGWVLKRMVRFGRGQYRINAIESGITPRLVCGFPGNLLTEILRQAARVAWSAVSADSDTLFRERRKLSFLYGGAMEGRDFHSQAASGSPLKGHGFF